MAKQKFYAVKEGHMPGIYFTWDDCRSQVEGYKGAKYQSFKSIDDAYQYMQAKEESQTVLNVPQTAVEVPQGPYAFVDGSFNPETKVYGYGGFLDVMGRRYPLMGSGTDPEMASMRNVAGEIEGSMAAVRKAEELNLRQLTILYDYKGVEEWAVGRWDTNKAGTAAYQEFMKPENRRIELSFQKVAAHTGIEGNEMADVMAKRAVGIKLTGPQTQLLGEALSAGKRDGADISGIIDRQAEKEMHEWS